MSSRDQHPSDVVIGLSTVSGIVNAFLDRTTDFIDESRTLHRFNSDTGTWTRFTPYEIVQSVYSDSRYRIHGKALDSMGQNTFYSQVRNLSVQFLAANRVQRSIGFIKDANGDIFNSRCELVPASSKIFLKGALPVAIDVNATCPLLDTFLDRYGLESDAIDAVLALCFFHALGRPNYQIHKYVFVTGVAGSGKSTFCNLLTECFTHSSGKFLDICRGRNGSRRDELLDNALFVSTEENFKAYRNADVDMLKAIVAGEPIDIEKKNENPYSGRPISLPILVTNDPEDWGARLREPAVLRRTLHLDFDVALDPSKSDPHLMAKMLQGGAREALVARAFKAFTRLADNNGNFNEAFDFKQVQLGEIQQGNSPFQDAVNHFGLKAYATQESQWIKNTTLSAWLSKEFGWKGHPRTLVKAIAVAEDGKGHSFQSTTFSRATHTLIDGFSVELSRMSDEYNLDYADTTDLGTNNGHSAQGSYDLFEERRSETLNALNNSTK